MDNSLWCWGISRRGANGTGSLDAALAPTRIFTPEILGLPVFGQEHACAIARSGKLYCWGEASDGQLGDGRAFSPTAVAVQ